jgi:hypothetical protein
VKIVAFDFDSTIASTVRRRPLIPADKDDGPGWQAYSQACADDEPIEGTVALMRVLRSFLSLHIVTGRSELARSASVAWLRRFDVPYDRLFMRSVSDDRLPNAYLKIKYIRQMARSGNEVVLFVEDWEPCAREIRTATGVPVLMVNPCDPLELQLAGIQERLSGRTGLVTP